MTHDPYKWLTNATLDVDDAVFFGCSFTLGDGLPNKETHYAQQVANHFNKRLINFAVSGGSNNLIFEQFTQLNFHPGQLVVVQLTTLHRIRYCNLKNQLLNIMLTIPHSDQNLHKSLIEVYNHNFLFYELLSQVRAIIQLARLQKLRLVLWPIDYDYIYNPTQLGYFSDWPEFIPKAVLGGYFVDYAEDQRHPGIKSNNIIATGLIQHIEKIYQ